MSERLSERLSTSGASSCESSCQPRRTSRSPAVQQAASNQASRLSPRWKKQLVHPGSSRRSSKRPPLTVGQAEEGWVVARAAWRRRNSSCIQEKLQISSRPSVSAPPSERGAFRCQRLGGTSPSSYGLRGPQQDPEPTPHTSAARTLERIRSLNHRPTIRPGSSSSIPGGALASAAELSVTCAATQTRRPSAPFSALADSLQQCRRKLSMSDSEKQRRGSATSDVGEDKLTCSATDLDALHIA